MKVDYLIIGQGICGTWLGYYLLKAGKKIAVIDMAHPQSATRSASGVINPVTGRQVVTTWMANDLLPFCHKAYSEFGLSLNASIIEQKNIIAFPSSFQMKEAYDKRIQEENSYIFSINGKKKEYREIFNYLFEGIKISPVYLIDLMKLLAGWRNKLENQNSLINETFEEELLIPGDGTVSYKNITAQKIIYCNGVETAKSLYWQNLPFIANKGQALILSIPLLPGSDIYKFGNLTLVPWYNNLWWAGSSYENDYETVNPTQQFKDQTLESLKNVLKIPFIFKDHIASLRPAVLAERRPFVGIHPVHPSIAILNGMGSKGCSLAPWFAYELCHHLVDGKSIDPFADVKRFTKMLGRKNF